jgi:2-polyprenyl-3-methyl-5-hydroxy-6-metoxy-1,4-benzoquinol methylase
MATTLSTIVSPDADFPCCPVCGTHDWKLVHEGNVRDGAFGHSRISRVGRCPGCGIDRLAESACLKAESYSTEDYRTKLKQDHVPEHHFNITDELVRFTLDAVWPRSLRGKCIADVGCAGGSLLDHLHGVAKKLLAIEPALLFSASLQQRGYEWFASLEEAASVHCGKVDLVFSAQVIEHVDNPRAFLTQIAALLSTDGIAVISTPNRRDILMEILPNVFPSFFYRVQHRWAFDAASLSSCAEIAGLEVAEVRHVHRYGIGNAMYWLRDKEARGRTSFEPLDSTMDKHWQAWLESSGRADNLYLILRKPIRNSDKP